MLLKSINILSGENKVYFFNNAFKTSNGEILEEIQLSYATFGEMNAERSNVVLIHHGISANSLVSSLNISEPGWWQDVVGKDKFINTNKYFIICIEYLDCNISKLTIEDMVNAEELLLASLSITQLYAIIGNSMGGMLSLTWLRKNPSIANYVIITATTHKANEQNKFLYHLQKEYIQIDSDEGYKLARKIALLNYRTPAAWQLKFQHQSVEKGLESYLNYNVDKLTKSTSVKRYSELLNAMYHYDFNNLSFSPTHKIHSATVFVISIDSDQLFYPTQQQETADVLNAMGFKTYLIKFPSTHGHDAFLIEQKRFGSLLSSLIFPPEIICYKPITFKHQPDAIVCHDVNGSNESSSNKIYNI